VDCVRLKGRTLQADEFRSNRLATEGKVQYHMRGRSGPLKRQIPITKGGTEWGFFV
jgi:hypothetical protein